MGRERGSVLRELYKCVALFVSDSSFLCKISLGYVFSTANEGQHVQRNISNDMELSGLNECVITENLNVPSGSYVAAESERGRHVTS